jgi:5-methylcytosine-specific restriction endonuclease McrA
MAANKNDGLAWNCKACAAKSYALWRAANRERVKLSKAAYEAKNRERVKASHAAWRKANIEHVKASTAEYRALHREDAKARSVAWRAKNTERSRSGVKAWRAANPEKVKKILSTWKEENPYARRIYEQNREAYKRARGKLSKGIVEILFKRQHGRCACCGEKLGKDYQLDHIMPLALGGANIDSNVQLLKKRCNQQKNKKHPIEFMRERGFLL